MPIDPKCQINSPSEEDETEEAQWSQRNQAWQAEEEDEQSETSYTAPVTRAAANNAGSAMLTGPPESSDRSSFCQRCFLRTQYVPDHVCVVNGHHRACQWCARMRQKCRPVPAQFNGLVHAALELSGAAQAVAIARIRQRIRQRTQLLNQEKAAKRATSGAEKEKGQ